MGPDLADLGVGGVQTCSIAGDRGILARAACARTTGWQAAWLRLVQWPASALSRGDRAELRDQVCKVSLLAKNRRPSALMFADLGGAATSAWVCEVSRRAAHTVP